MAARTSPREHDGAAVDVALNGSQVAAPVGSAGGLGTVAPVHAYGGG
jgi:hypothetical protein